MSRAASRLLPQRGPAGCGASARDVEPGSGTAGDDETPAAAARRGLGEALAELRLAAGLSLRQLGRLTGYHHTVVAHSEKGRPASETFWKLADCAVNGQGTLTALYHQVRGLERAAREEARRHEQATREERAARHLSRRQPDADLPGPCAATATVACPNCRQPIELVPRVVAEISGLAAGTTRAGPGAGCAERASGQLAGVREG